ncbi:hypothetical protein Tco_1068933 [Tanacetum coccineum]|uniref:Uncharacterized protein n=1 Tax=Tanacetum coccineum TaxID=301880 RepID=A0ABQ5HHB3_9ASTR
MQRRPTKVYQDNQSGQFGNQRTMTVAGTRETVGTTFIKEKDDDVQTSDTGVPLMRYCSDHLLSHLPPNGMTTYRSLMTDAGCMTGCGGGGRAMGTEACTSATASGRVTMPSSSDLVLMSCPDRPTTVKSGGLTKDLLMSPTGAPDWTNTNSGSCALLTAMLKYGPSMGIHQDGAAEQADWLADTDEEIDEQELEAHYSFMEKIQEVLPEESSSTEQPLEQVQNHDENNVFANKRRHSEQPKSINGTYVLEKDDSNVTPDSSNICNNDNQVDQNAA